MSVTVQEILHTLETLAPPTLACTWDNVGLLVDAGNPVTTVLTALDITSPIIEEAVKQGAQLIVSHHPVIFDPLKTLSAADVPALLLKNGISAICMHTNLDAASDGVNDTLADILGISRTDRINFAENCGRIGTLQTPTTVADLAKKCADLLHSGIKYVPHKKPDKKIIRLAEVSGAGGNFVREAIGLGADCVVTGEAAHHVALLAKQKGVGLIVAGHWGTEAPAADMLAEYLSKHFPSLVLSHAKADTDPYTYIL